MQSASQPHVLVVDDDDEIRNLVARYLGGQGFHVSTAADGTRMRAELESRPADVILLDLGLPGEDGLSLTRYLREQWDGPIIIVSGRGEPVERVVGLELGADDYVTKPFDLRELLARVRSVLRRSAQPQAATVENGDYRFEGYRLDPRAHRLTDAEGREIPLTSGEFGLLLALVERPQQVLSRDQLMLRTHGHETGPYDRAIDVRIGRLRRKIEADPANPAMIRSVRGAGYLFAVPVTRD